MANDIPNSPKQLDYRWIAEKFGLLITPAIAYFLVFTYESAYCRNFAVPPSFIHPDLTTILIYTSVVIGVGFFLVGLINAWIDAFKMPSPSEPLFHALRLYAPFAIILVFIIFLYGTAHWGRWLLFGILLVVLMAMDFLLALTRDKEKAISCAITRSSGDLERTWHGLECGEEATRY